MSKKKFKKFVKKKIKKAAFNYLLSEKEKKSKVKAIKYSKFKLQKYFTSNLFSDNEVQTLNKTRSRNLNVKSNFKTQYENDLSCSLENCTEIEDQPHLLKCKPLISKLNKKFNIKEVKYDDIFSNTKKQKKVIEVLIALIKTRDKMLPKSD